MSSIPTQIGCCDVARPSRVRVEALCMAAVTGESRLELGCSALHPWGNPAELMQCNSTNAPSAAYTAPKRIVHLARLVICLVRS